MTKNSDTANIHMPIMTKFLHGFATMYQWAFMGGLMTSPTNPIWRTAAILNFVKCWISP